MTWKIRLDTMAGATLDATYEIPSDSAPPQAIVRIVSGHDSSAPGSVVYVKIGEEPGWPYSGGSRLIYREVTSYEIESRHQ